MGFARRSLGRGTASTGLGIYSFVPCTCAFVAWKKMEALEVGSDGWSDEERN